ncbi:cytochrome P450 [Aspergillus lucknowensis]|uniref:Cytochrome P450 n=1 Tax=Aspergillus lucknowensis TaxID=176173 RepID=A0ABR4LSH5_9EURO
MYKWATDTAPKVPSPPGLPLIGNTLQLPSQPHRQFLKWARQYGEIYRVRLGLMDWYMLNSPQAVKEILDKQSAVTSSRPPMPVVSDALSGGMRFLFMPYGAEWRRLRSVSHRLLTPRMSDTFQPSQDFEAKQLLYDLLTDNSCNKEFYMHIRRYTVSVLMTSIYGRRVPKWECDDVRGIYQIVNDLSYVSTPGRYIADGVPHLAQLLPEKLQWWRKSLEPMLELQRTVWMKHWTRLRTQMEQGKAPECFVKQFIQSQYHTMGITEVQAAFLAGSMIEAGAESTSAALNSCMLYLSAHPDAQQRAHEELDTVVGRLRSPSFDDIDNLPYIRAIVKEILRIRPLASMGIPHYATDDVQYKEYTIPKGSVIAIQQYAIHYDPSLFPDPEHFRPERYLHHPERTGVYAASSANPYQRDHWDFGAGRRVCPGMHLAENSLFITIAKILWAFRVVPTGKVDLSNDAYLAGSITVPKPFEAKFVCRDSLIENVLRTEWEVAERDGYILRDTKVDAAGVMVE